MSEGLRSTPVERAVVFPLSINAVIKSGLSAATSTPDDDPILHTTLYSVATVQVNTTCVPTGATTDTGCSKNTDTAHETMITCWLNMDWLSYPHYCYKVAIASSSYRLTSLLVQLTVFTGSS